MSLGNTNIARVRALEMAFNGLSLRDLPEDVVRWLKANAWINQRGRLTIGGYDELVRRLPHYAKLVPMYT